MTDNTNPNKPPRISLFNVTADGLLVEFETHADATTSGATFFSWLWLRDHGNDEASLDPVTLQRRVDTFSIPSNLAAENVRHNQQNELIEIDWNDRTSTTVSTRLMAGMTEHYAPDHQLLDSNGRVVWDQNAPLDNLPRVNYDEVMSCEPALLDWLKKIATYGFSIVDGVPTSDEATEGLAERVGPVQETLFGRMWHLSAELEDHGDTAYTTDFLEPHTDSIYYHDAPGLQMFNCQEFDGKGGESIQVDAFAIAQRIKIEDPDAYATLCEITVPGHYLEPGVHVRAERPVFRVDAQGNLTQVSFNNYDRAPMHLSAADEKRFYHAYGLFHKHAIDQRNWLKIPLRPGMTLIFDNWRVMHGRMGYVGKRVFYGCYHNMAVFESQLRALKARLVTTS